MSRTLAMFSTLALLACTACATVPQDPAARAAYYEANDPLEPMNRKIFAANEFLDRFLFKPVAEGYRTVLPQFVRTGIRNALNNLQEPLVVINNGLQGQFERAGISLDRFIFNSTIGVGGLIDFAGDHGLKRQSGDFGQTLYSWGVPEGFYLVLPIFGPSSPRDGVGMGVDSFMDPFRYVLASPDPDASTFEDPNVIRSAVDGIDKRANTIDELDAIKKNSIDFYAAIRSYYRQNRADELRHGEPPPTPASPALELYQDPAKKQNSPPDLYEDPAKGKTP